MNSPTIIPAKVYDGYHTVARSSCCTARIVKFDSRLNYYRDWDGFDRNDDGGEKRCQRCNRVVVDAKELVKP